MKVSKKLLHPYEQSLLLVAMLFSRKHLDALLQLFPDEQVERIKHAKERFLSLEKNERLTQIILELRRLLLTKDTSASCIHPSWISDELQKEPDYLRALLNEELGARLSREKNGFFPRSLLLQSFTPPFMAVPPKIALFDPVLMRLQALKENHVTKTIATIGAVTTLHLGEFYRASRFKGFIARKYPSTQWDKFSLAAENPFSDATLRSHALTYLVQKSPQIDTMGLFSIAAYLYFHKPRWHQAIELALPKPIGRALHEINTQFASLTLMPELKLKLATMLIHAMDDTFK